MNQFHLAGYLFKRLQELGVSHTFGIPGDFALPLYRAQHQSGMKTVVSSHEPNALFAADAYARLKGLGVAVATYGPGALNMVNPMAMAFAEHSPVLLISAAPALGQRQMSHIHHLVKNHQSQTKIMSEVCAVIGVLDNPARAAEEIDQVLEIILRERRPGYLEIPSDMTFAPLPETSAARPWAKDEREGPDHTEALAEAVAEIERLLSESESPLLMVGVGVRRSGLMAEVIALAEARGLPVISSVMGKGVFPESHELFHGIFMGTLGDPETVDLVRQSDCLLRLGVIDSDVNNGFGTVEVPVGKSIDIKKHLVRVRHHQYADLGLPEVVRALAPAVPGIPAPRKTKVLDTALPDDEEAVTMKALTHALQAWVDERTLVLADVGESWFLGLDLKVDTFMAPGYYASMGFAVPGAVGASFAEPEMRPLVLTGDGSFQMTGNDLGLMKQSGLNPIIIVINNRYFELLEVIDGPKDYFQVPNWDYVGIAQAQGCRGKRIQTIAELKDGLSQAFASREPFLLEVVTERNDHAPIMARIEQFFKEKREPQMK